MSATANGSAVRRIVISGCGPEAAAAAAALAVSLQGSEVEIALVSPAGGQISVGVERIRGGEQAFHRRLGIDEKELVRETSGAYSLGTRFSNFAGNGEAVFVPLGSHGMTLRLLPFHQYWCHRHAAGSIDPYNDYSLPAVAAALGHFDLAKAGDDPVYATWAYDLLVDPDLIAHYYRDSARKLGVTVLDDNVAGSTVDSQGYLETIRLERGGDLDADFFIDCSAGRELIGLLADADDFGDWSACLPCDRMLSALIPSHGGPRPYSVISALDKGWLAQETLAQFSVGSLAYCSLDVDDADAKVLLEKSMRTVPVRRSAIRRWRSGSYRHQWIRNCVALGPAALAVEPLHVSSLQLACNAILRLLGMLPATRDNPMLATEFNCMMAEEHAGVRDFTLLYYQLARRPDSAFWSRWRDAPLPETLRRRMQLFGTNGRLEAGENEWFNSANWLASLINFGVLPRSTDPLVEMADRQRIDTSLQAFRQGVRAAVET